MSFYRSQSLQKSVYLQRISATYYALQKYSATHFALQNSRCKKQGCRFSATLVNAALQKSATHRTLQYSRIRQLFDEKLQTHNALQNLERWSLRCRISLQRTCTNSSA